MVSTEEILITMLAQDNASDVFDQVANNAQSSLSGISGGASSAGGSFSQLGYTGGLTFSGLTQGVQKLNVGMMGLSSATGMFFNELGAKKSASEYVYGTSSAEDTNKVLLQGMQDSEEQGESLYKTIDNATDNALVSMQDIIPALNVIQAGTGATGQEIENVTDKVAQFGSYVLAQTGSIAKSNEAMQALEKGMKGSYQILQHYGVTARSLENVGWGGDEEDVEDFMNAVIKVIGPTEDLMNTSEGLDAQIGKMWSRAGKQIGREILPYTKSLKTEFLQLDQSMGGQLSKSILMVQFGIETLQGKFYQISSFMSAINEMNEGWNAMKTILGGIGQTATDSAQAVSNLAETGANVSQMGATATQVGSEAMTGMGIGGEIATDVALDTALNRGKSEEGEKLISSTQGKQGEELWDEVKKQTEASRKGASVSREAIANLEADQKFLTAMADEWSEVENGYRAVEEIKKDFGEYLSETSYEDIDWDMAWAVADGEDLMDKGVEGFSSIFDDVPSATPVKMDKFGPKLPQTETAKFDKSDIFGTGPNFDDLVKQSEGSRAKASETLNFLRGNANTEKEIIEEMGDVWYDAETGGYTKIKDKVLSAKNSILGFDFGESIRTFGSRIGGGLQSGLKSLANIPSLVRSGFGKAGTSITEAFSSVKTTFDNIKSNGIEGNLNKVFDGFSNTFSKLKGSFKGAEDIGEVVEDVAKVGTAGEVLATTAPAMEAGAAGAEATAVAETTLSGAFMEMLIPTLAIAGVIAVLIPVVAGLALEALFFINLIGQVITAMNFDSINIDGVAEKLQELAMVFAWIGVAMAGMTFAGIMSAIGTVSASLLSLMGGFPQVVQLLTQVANEIRPLGQVTVDESVAVNLQNLGNALNGISMAMLSLNGVTLSTFVGNILTMGGLLGSLSGNLEGAKKDLQQAIDTINSLDFGGVDESKVQQISTVMEAIGNFGSAFDGLLKIRDGAKWSDITNMLLDGIFGTSTDSVQEAFEKAHNDLKVASQKLETYNDLEKVDEGTAEKIKNVSDSIVAIADALEALAKLKEDKGFMGAIDSFLNGSNDNLISGLDTANKVIRQTASRVASLRTIANIPENVTDKLKNLTDTLKLVMDALDGMKQIKSSDDGGGDLDKIPSIIQKAHHSIRLVAQNVADLRTISNIDPKVSDKLTQLNNALTDINEALTNIATVNSTSGGWDFKGLDTKYTGITHTISSFAFQIANLGKNLSDESHAIPEGLSSKLHNISESATALNSALIPIRTMPKIENNVGTNIENSVKMVSDTAGQLNGLKGVESVDKSVSTLINRVGASANILKRVANQMKGFPLVSSTLVGFRVTQAVNTVKNVAKSLKGFNKDDKVGNISDTLKSVQTGISQLKKTIDGMNFKPQGSNIGKSIKSGIGSGLGGLAGTISGKVSGAGRTARSSGWTVGAGVGENVVKGTKSGLKGLSQMFKDEMGYIKQSLDNHGDLVASAKAMAEAVVQGAKEGSQVKSPGAIAHMWEDEMGYSSMLMERGSSGLIRTARNVASNVVSTFNNRSTLTPKLMNFDSVKSDLNKAQIGTMMELRKPSTMGKKQRPVHINVSEGAVQLDARSMTLKESRQIMINALEGLEMVNGVDVKNNI